MPSRRSKGRPVADVVVLVDANLLLYAVNESDPHHQAALDWVTDQLNGTGRVALPWQSLGAFLRISTHPRAWPRPLSAGAAWSLVDDWLSAPATWVPSPEGRHSAILAALITRHELTGNLVPDGMLAALAIEHGLTVCSVDSDFARFDEIAWANPLA
jgi:toxin-antitoxin system PIN domain toxin